MDPGSQPPHLWVILAIALLALFVQGLLARSARPRGSRPVTLAFWVTVTAWMLWGLMLPSPADAPVWVTALRWVLPGVGLLVAALVRMGPADRRWLLRDEIRATPLPEEATEAPQLDEEDRRLVGRLAGLMGRSAAELMTPLGETVHAREDQSVADVLGLMRERQVFRVPVLDGSGERALGVLVSKDLLPHLPVPPGRSAGATAASADKAVELRRPIAVIDGSRPVAEVLDALRSNAAGIAAVRDARSRILGFISWDQIFRALVGRAAAAPADTGRPRR